MHVVHARKRLKKDVDRELTPILACHRRTFQALQRGGTGARVQPGRGTRVLSVARRGGGVETIYRHLQ